MGAAPDGPTPRPGGESPLVGREREQAVLRDALANALAGRGSLVLIGGEAGIGKTTLAEATLAEAAQHDALVLIGRCYDLSETPPYGPWRGSFDRAPRDDGLPRLPVVVLPPDSEGEALTGQEAIFRRVLTYVAALAVRRPLVLLLDDLHLADPASLDLLRVVARGLADLSVLLLATYRAEEVAGDHPLAALLPLLVREARAGRLDLRPLDRAAIGALVAARYALADAEHDRLADYLAGRTEGNALFLGELLRTLEAEGALHRDGARWAVGDLDRAPVPTLLRQVIAGRVARLGGEAQRLLAVAAVVGQEVPLALWAAVAGTDEDGLLDAVERATGARLLVETPDGAGVRFAHALVREALYAATPLPRRRAWHRRAGEALLASRDPDPDAVANHFQRAGDPRAADWLVRAGERAQRAYAWLTAAERFEAALALLGTADGTASERVQLLFRLATLRRYADPQGSIAYLDEAARLTTAGANPALGVWIALQQGLYRCFVGEIRRGIAEMAAGVAAYDALSPDDQARTWALQADGDNRFEDDGRGTLAMWLADAGRYAEARQLGEHLADLAEGGSRPLYAVDGQMGLATALAMLGLPDAAARAFETARAAAAAIGHHALVSGSATEQLERVALPYQADRLAERRYLATEAVQAQARAGGAGMEPAYLPRLSGLPLLEVEGRWAEARAIGDAERAAGTTRKGAPFARFPSPLARLAQQQGEADHAWTLIREGLPDGPAAVPGDTEFFPVVGLQRVAVALALDAGDLTAARAWLDCHDRWLAWSGAVLGQVEGALGWAAYHRAAGDAALASRHAEAALARATEPRQPLALIAAHRLLGELATDAGHHVEAATHVGTALALATACAAPYERALTLLALAELRAADGQLDEAGAPLVEARAILADLGAAPALARADALAPRLATAPPAVAPALAFGLTAREAEVLRLVAAGLTNAQAAERLFLSPKTVSRHLDNIYAKLGVATRTAAAGLAREHGLA